jgi:hypothetical protein
VPVDFVIEEIRCQIECLGKNPAQRLGDPVKFVPIGLQGGPKRNRTHRPQIRCEAWIRCRPGEVRRL